jgi:transcriptional repressor NrdR
VIKKRKNTIYCDVLMLCPYCLSKESKVIDKRDVGATIRRRRECLKCMKRFNTRENVDRVELRVIKKDRRREDFDREKVRKGVLRACEKRPVSDEKIEKMIMRTEERLRKKGKEVKTEFIGELVSRELKKLDKVAYIRFASVYKDFTDLDDFKKEIRGLITK